MAKNLTVPAPDQMLGGNWQVSLVGLHGVDKQAGLNGTAFQRLGWTFGRLYSSGGQTRGVSCNVNQAFSNVIIDPIQRTIVGKLRENTPVMVINQPDPEYFELLERRVKAEAEARLEALRRPASYSAWY